MDLRLRTVFSISPLKISIVLIIAVIVLYFFNLSFLRFMELKALDLRMVSRGERPSGGETVIAAIDEKSLGELGRWPWSRSTIARLVDALKAYEAKAIGFDIVFAEPDDNAGMRDLTDISRQIEQLGIKDPRLSGIIRGKRAKADTDADLTKSIKRAGNVTLGYFFHTSRKDVAHLSEAVIRENAERIFSSKYQIIQFRSSPDTSAMIEAHAVVPNIKEITDAAQNCGYFNAFPDSDGVLRWAPLVIRFQDDFYPSLALSVLLQYMDWPMLALNLGDTGVEGIRMGDIDIPTDESGRMLINYLGPAKTFPHYSISDIIHGRLDPELIRDKIVLVGATATGIYDLRTTPYSAVYPGVEVHANVIDNIIHSDFIRRPGWTGLLDILAIISFGLIIGVALPRTGALQGFFLSFAVLTAFVFGNVYVFSHHNLWIDLVYPALTIIVVYTGVTVYKYITEERERKKIRNAFQYYLTSSVINEMLKDPSKLKLGGEKKDLTVLFSDIRGFTTISEKLSPEELVQLLNEYLTAMTNVVFKYDGLLDKYMGDAIMAVFGAPLSQIDHAARACRTGLDMMKELRGFQKKWSEEGKPVLNIGIGINSGEMVVGNMGSEMRFDYTVMGDSVNLGSRLEGINKEYGTNIVISEFTHDKIQGAFICRELDSVRVKGKKFPVRIYELLAEEDGSGEQFAWVKIFEEGLAKYRQQQWDAAVSDFRKVLEVRPDDQPSLHYIERCNELKESPPGAGWDGVYTMTGK
ncbi:MAG: CHASE2 domain-containing protein [Syntrophales bacterium]